MSADVFKKAFDEAKLRLAEAKVRSDQAVAELQLANQDIVHFRRAVASLAVLCNENVEDSVGLTLAIRQTFELYETWMSVRDVKERIEMFGGTVVDLKNPDASIQSVLNRLTAAGELQPGTRKFKNEKGVLVDQKVWRPAPPPGRGNESKTSDDDPFAEEEEKK